MNCQQGLLLWKPSRKSLFCLPCGGFACNLWLLLACRSITLIFAFIFTTCSPCVRVCVQTAPFHKDTSHIRLGPTLMTSSEFITSVTFCFHIRPHSEVFRVRTSTYKFGGGGRRGSKVLGGTAVPRFYLKTTVAQGQC